MVILLSIGFFGHLDNLIVEVFGRGYVSLLSFFAVISGGSFLLSLPFSVYRTFVIEEKYGFNNMDWGTFVRDKFKSIFIGSLIGGTLLAGFFYIYESAGAQFCIYTWFFIAGFMLIMNIIYIPVILPIFNQLKPLEDGSLKNAIREYCSRNNFPLNDIYIMDSSKRTAKANAFFSGLGTRKKIVLFDNLIKTHTDEEIVAIVAHEVGHYFSRHTLKNLGFGLLQSALVIWLFAWFIENQDVASALGAYQNSVELSLFSFGIVYSPFSLATGFLVNYFSRKFEFEADAFAASSADGTELQNALLKLTTNNLSNPDPHPVTVFSHYSHPPILLRLRNLESLKNV
jgi:STE24 endopeptidase